MFKEWMRFVLEQRIVDNTWKDDRSQYFLYSLILTFHLKCTISNTKLHNSSPLVSIYYELKR